MDNNTMRADRLLCYCKEKHGATCDRPFGAQPDCVRVGGRIFAQVFPVGVPGALTLIFGDPAIPREAVSPMMTLCCDPAEGDFYRKLHPGAVRRPYHVPPAGQPYANTVLIDGSLPEAELLGMIDHAYETVLGKLPKGVRATMGHP